MLDNKNDNFGSADQNKSYGSNDDMVESDKVLWRYEDLLDKLDKHIWIHFLHRYDHFVVKWANTWRISYNEKNYLNLQVCKGRNLSSEIGLYLHHQKFCNLGRNTRIGKNFYIGIQKN